MIPGLMAIAPSIPEVALLSNETDVDLNVKLSSPPAPLDFTLVIASGVTISATSTSVFALNGNNLPAGSVCVHFQNDGAVRGAGGDGGNGANRVTVPGESTGGHGGGGGGGAGTIAGLKGTGDPNAANGADGTASAGGLGGASVTEDETVPRAQTDGSPAGHAIQAGITFAAVTNGSGTIWGGGGGGGGGIGSQLTGNIPGGDGGDPGQAGGPGSTGGAAGKAVELAGGTFTFLSGGADPQTKGAVS